MKDDDTVFNIQIKVYLKLRIFGIHNIHNDQVQ